MPSIIAVLPFYLPFPGGAEKSTHERLRRLVNEGFTVDALVAPMPQRFLTSTLTDVMDGVFIKRPRIHYEFLAELRQSAATADIIFYSRANLLRHIYDTSIDRILWPYREKTMYFVHDLDPCDYFEAAFVVANSDTTKEQLPESVTSRVLVLKPLIGEMLPVTEASRRFIAIVNPCLSKGGDLFVELAQALPNVLFLAQLGSGMPVSAITTVPNIQIQQPQPDLSEMYGDTNVLLVPSRREPFGRVAIEGAMAGCLILAHRIDGLREVPLSEYSFMEDLSLKRWKRRLVELLRMNPTMILRLRKETETLARTYDPGWEKFLSCLLGLHRHTQSLRGRFRPTQPLSSPIKEVEDIFNCYIPTKLALQPRLAGRIDSSYKLVLLGRKETVWTLELHASRSRIGKVDKDFAADCTIVLAEKDFLDALLGEISLEYLSSLPCRIAVSGDASRLVRLAFLLR